jgi:hypothetical protein
LRHAEKKAVKGVKPVFAVPYRLSQAASLCCVQASAFLMHHFLQHAEKSR